MNIIDIILLVPLVWFGYKGFKKGFVIEVFGLLALFAGIYAAIYFSDFASNFLINNVKIKSEYLPVASFGLTFIVVVIGVHFLGKMITRVVKMAALGPVNKIFGAVFSIVRLLLIYGVALNFINTTNQKFDFIPQEHLEESVLYEPVMEATEVILPAIKDSKYYEQFLKWKQERKEDENNSTPDKVN